MFYCFWVTPNIGMQGLTIRDRIDEKKPANIGGSDPNEKRMEHGKYHRDQKPKNNDQYGHAQRGLLQDGDPLRGPGRQCHVFLWDSLRPLMRSVS